jgi:hypothetical protein
VQDAVVRTGIVDQRIILRTVEELKGLGVLLVTRGLSVEAQSKYSSCTYIHCLGGMLGLVECWYRRKKRRKVGLI